MAALGFVTVMLQLINPKAYAVNTMLFSSFAFYPDNFAIETGLKLLINNAMDPDPSFVAICKKSQPTGSAGENSQNDQFVMVGVFWRWLVVNMVTLFTILTGKGELWRTREARSLNCLRGQRYKHILLKTLSFSQVSISI